MITNKPNFESCKFKTKITERIPNDGYNKNVEIPLELKPLLENS